MENTQTTRRYTPEEYNLVSDRVQIKVEYLKGQIVPKESLHPLPDWVVDELLKPNFNRSILNYEFPMTSKNHKLIIKNITRNLNLLLDEDNFQVFSQDPEIFIALSGSYRVPDVGVTPPDEDCEWEGSLLTNPIVVIEVLSPSNKNDEFLDKIEDYKSLESLQEYWLVSQDKVRLERFVRIDAKRWENRTYNQKDEEVEFPSLGVVLQTEKIFKGVEMKKA